IRRTGTTSSRRCWASSVGLYWPRWGSLRPGGADHAAGITRGDDALRDVAGADAAGTDGGAIADGDAAKDNSAGADPAVLANGDRPVDAVGAGAPAGLGIDADALGGIDGMPRRQELHPGPDRTAIADADVGPVEEDAVEIDEDVVADMDVPAVLEGERREDHAAADAAQHLSEHRPTRLHLARGRGIEDIQPGAGF